MFNYDREKDQYFCLGKVIKTHSFRGELVFLFETNSPESYADLKNIFINIEGSLVPWFIEKLELQGEKAIAKLEDVDTIEMARTFVKRDIYLPIDKIDSSDKEAVFFREIIGFKVIDAVHGEIGIVKDILERPEQEIIQIEFKGKEILVPLSDEMISKVDHKKEILHLDTPEGLIELYLR